ALLLITLPSTSSTQSIVTHVRTSSPELRIVARAESIEELQHLHQLGVYEVVQPEFEAGLEIVRQALLHLNIPIDEIRRLNDNAREELYAPLYRA
ncbi:MAG: portal protein, partial [Burkholderiales bacterium]|nr:portal protein [Anaerolineae bacterium]